MCEQTKKRFLLHISCILTRLPLLLQSHLGRSLSSNSKGEITLAPSGIIDVLTHAGAIRKEHRRLSSGLHTDTFVDMQVLFDTYPNYASILCGSIANDLFKHDVPADIIIGPAEGAKFVAQHIAIQLAHRIQRPVNWTYAKKLAKNRYRLLKTDKNLFVDRNVVVVDDVITSGGSLMRTIHLIKDAGGTISAIAALCNRGRLSTEFDTPHFFTVFPGPGKIWHPWECELCKAGKSIVN